MESSPKHGHHFRGKSFLPRFSWSPRSKEKAARIHLKNDALETNKSGIYSFLVPVVTGVFSFFFEWRFTASTFLLPGFFRGFGFGGEGFLPFRDPTLANPIPPFPAVPRFHVSNSWYLHGWRRRAHGKAPSHVAEARNKGLTRCHVAPHRMGAMKAARPRKKFSHFRWLDFCVFQILSKVGAKISRKKSRPFS